MKVGRQRGSEEISRIGLGELLGVVVLQICERQRSTGRISGCDRVELFFERRIGIESEAGVPLAHDVNISMLAKVTAAEENDLKPNIGRTLRLIHRWSCSILLFRYLLLWTLIFFNARRVLPRNRFSASPEMTAPVVFRKPATLAAFSMQDGRLVTSAGACGDADDLFVDTKRHRIYMSCGEGYLDVFEPENGGFRRIARLPTASGARTSLFVPQLDCLFLAVRAGREGGAAIWVYRPAS